MVKKKIANNIDFIKNLTTTTFRGYATGDFGKATAVLKKSNGGGYKLCTLGNWSHIGDSPSSLSGFHWFPGKVDLKIHSSFQTGQNLHSRRNKRSLVFGNHDLDGFGGTEPHTEVAFFRSAIPVNKDVNPLLYFGDEWFETEQVKTRGLIPLIIEKQLFHYFVAGEKGKKFVFIDSCAPISLEEFQRCCWTISIAIGFFTGELWQGEAYTFSYDRIEMEEIRAWSYDRLGKSIVSGFPAVTSLPRQWIPASEVESIEKFEKIVKGVNPEVISNLCSWIHSNNANKAIIFLIAEAKNASTMMMPAGFAIAIEGIATIFEEMFPEKIAPIKLKATAQKFRSELLAVLNNYESGPDFDRKTLENKITQINLATNQKKLESPFKLLRINLLPEDYMALEYRNALLHGNVTLVPSARLSFEMQELELGLRLMTLANCLILKMIGHSGYVINHVKANEKIIKRSITGEIFRDIGNYDEVGDDIRNVAQTVACII